MTDREEVINTLKDTRSWFDARYCFEDMPTGHLRKKFAIELMRRFRDDVDKAIALLKEQEEERRRLISWMSKFCVHIENLDHPLTDTENLAFFKRKMNQQFGWEVSWK